MVGGKIFSKTQGTETFQSRSYRRQRPRFVKNLMPASQPMSYAGNGPVEKGKRRLRNVQAAQPAPNCGTVRQPIRVFQLGRRLLPRTVLRNAPQQRLATRQQTEMRVRKREQRKEGKGRPAIGAAARTNPNPAWRLIVVLLPAPSVTNDRIPFTKRTAAKDDVVAVFCPVRGKLARR